MAILSKKHAGCSTGCSASKWVVCLLLLFVALAALVGVYQTHVIVGTDPARFAIQFGSTSGSLSIIAFVVAVMAWGKKMSCCMSGSCEVCK
ncbi:hypothetical protein EXS65_02340 [Candidatus Peribacteria bacterium]|nr:hypothetical protein [Candidatus Peribacteria bacterium]